MFAKFSSPILATAAIGVVRNRASVLLLLFLSESLPIVLLVLQDMVGLFLSLPTLVADSMEIRLG